MKNKARIEVEITRLKKDIELRKQEPYKFDRAQRAWINVNEDWLDALGWVLE